MRRPTAWLLLWLLWTPAAAADPAAELRAAIAARLALMADVARYKWNHDLAVADPARERALLEDKVEGAVRMGVDRAYAHAVLEAQLAASRTLQTQLIERWRTEARGRFAAVPDLATRQRPAIDAATERLLGALVAAAAVAPEALAATLAEPPAELRAHADAWTLAIAPLVRGRSGA